MHGLKLYVTNIKIKQITYIYIYDIGDCSRGGLEGVRMYEESRMEQK